ncbi:hypothetical protein HID58_031677, partial [Brassica napus]
MVLLYFYTSARQSTWLMFKKKITRRTDPPAGDKNKDYVNTLLVVAALVATVTFAAGFTIPGGFNSSEPNQGLPTLAGDRKLTYFMVFDILAMQSSIVTIATLIWAQLGDPALVHTSLNVALPSLFFALLCMPVAFYFGVFVVFARVKGLVIFLDVASAVFIFLMLFLLGPHVLLRIPGIPAAFGAYFVLFVLLVDDDHHEQASTAKISSEEASAAKSSSEEASAAKISVTTKKNILADEEKTYEENEIPVLDQVTFQGNTILHLAAIYGHDHLVRRILDHELNVLRRWNPNLVGNFAPSFSHYQTLLVRQNSEGNLALHVAAASGHELIVEFLVESLRRLPQDRNIVVRSEQILVGNIFSVSNNDGFTVLHLTSSLTISLFVYYHLRNPCFGTDGSKAVPVLGNPSVP